MMVLYEDKQKEVAKDIMLVDWQCITRASPLHDIGPLFYSTAPKDALDNDRDYMEVYYDELSKRIKELGSDPETVYPHSEFEKDRNSYGFFCFGFALTGIKGMLTKRENAPDLTERLKADDQSALETMFTDVADNVDEWMFRTKYLARHFISLGIL
ncbi:Ecdysteroid kinase-like family [Popillia japonica]|uniref:Ecdysteroid kinase-like family n=1 Tax=Popillia japonica TaxID=7064 RepID=A0AAW1HX79_POPJA